MLRSSNLGLDSGSGVLLSTAASGARICVGSKGQCPGAMKATYAKSSVLATNELDGDDSRRRLQLGGERRRLNGAGPPASSSTRDLLLAADSVTVTGDAIVAGRLRLRGVALSASADILTLGEATTTTGGGGGVGLVVTGNATLNASAAVLADLTVGGALSVADGRLTLSAAAGLRSDLPLVLRGGGATLSVSGRQCCCS